MNIRIDIERLRKDLMEESFGAFFGAGFGGAHFEAQEIKNMSPSELIAYAQKAGVNLGRYESR